MIRITGIAGSLRKHSFNQALLNAAIELAPDGVAIEQASIVGIPTFNQDFEKTNYPEAAAEIKQQIKHSDGVLLVTPEYNAGVPGVLKNVIDWLSRPPEEIESLFGAKPVALMGATPGSGGTRLSQTAWLATLRHLGMYPWFPAFTRQVYVAGAAKVFDDNDVLVDDKTREFVSQFLAGFKRFIESSAARSN